jgi:hypothetical protein
METGQTRYEVRGIADADCTDLCEDVLYRSDDLTSIYQALDTRKLSNRIYGCAILDRTTGLIDWGFGFGTPVPDPDDED